MRIKKHTYEKGKEGMDYCLIGNIMSNKLAYREALERVMGVAWGLSRKV